MLVNVGTFNLYNLALADRTYHQRLSYCREDYQKKISWLAEMFQDMEAHIVGFQEVFHREALEEALAESRVFDGECIMAGDEGEDPRVGLVSQLPITSWEAVTDLPREIHIEMEGGETVFSRFRRPIIKAYIKFSDEVEVVVFVVHLKSKQPLIEEDQGHDPVQVAMGQAKSLVMRAAETTGLRLLAIREREETRRPVILLGDFNENAATTSGEILTGLPPMGFISSEGKKNIWSHRFYQAARVHEKQSSRAPVHTHLRKGTPCYFDQIYLSPEFVHPHREGHVATLIDLEVYHHHLVNQAETQQRQPKWQSDHAPVVARFRLAGE